MPDTGEDRANTTKTSGNVQELIVNGTNYNELSGTDVAGGYTDVSSKDFTLTAAATLRSVEVDLFVGTSYYIHAGAAPDSTVTTSVAASTGPVIGTSAIISNIPSFQALR